MSALLRSVHRFVHWKNVCISLCFFEATGSSKVGKINCSSCSSDVGHTWGWMFSSQVSLPGTYVVGLHASNGPSTGMSSGASRTGSPVTGKSKLSGSPLPVA